MVQQTFIKHIKDQVQPSETHLVIECGAAPPLLQIIQQLKLLFQVKII